MEIIENEEFTSEIWLITGLYHSLPGLLSLKNGILTFMALGSGTYGKKGLMNIEIKCGSKDFCKKLKNNTPAKLFEININEIQKLTYPFIYFGGGAHIYFNNLKYRLSYIEPANTQMPLLSTNDYHKVFKRNVEIVQSIKHARQIGKKWKLLLTPKN